MDKVPTGHQHPNPLLLSQEEYEIIKNIKDNNKNRSYKQIYNLIKANILRLWQYNPEEIRQAYINKKNASHAYLPKNNDVNENIISAFLKIAQNPNNYLYNNVHPYMEQIKGNWSKDETNLLIALLEKSGCIPNWGLLSLAFPGRTGHSLYDKYLQLVDDGIIEELPKLLLETPQIHPESHKALPYECEIYLVERILTRYDEKQVTTTSFVKEEAREIYYMPVTLAKKAAICQFEQKKLKIKNEDHTYTDDITKLAEKLLEEAELDPSGFMEKYNIKDFVASPGWCYSFLKRNKLTLRICHVKRRGSIDQEYVDVFLIKLANAFLTYGEDQVYNVDETSIIINPNTRKTIAPLGADEVYIDANVNTKESFTCLATINKHQKLPLYILGKGTTKQCLKKFESVGNYEMNYSESGWTTEKVMMEYLSWLSSYTGKSNFCLVLDCFKSHITNGVKNHAKSLGIELIIVPANGTGLYQPLDRMVFGALKAKLRMIADGKIFSGKTRFTMIVDCLLKAWEMLSDKTLTAAWNIPGLAEKIEETKNSN